MDGNTIINEPVVLMDSKPLEGTGYPVPKRPRTSKTKAQRRREARQMFTKLHQEYQLKQQFLNELNNL